VADLKFSELALLAGVDLAGGDLLAVSDVSASESKKITVTDFIGKAVTLVNDATIPNAKILFTNNTVNGAVVTDNTLNGSKLANSTVTGGKLANNSSCQLVTSLPATGAYTGQLALDTNASKGYIWNGSSWVSFKAAGSINEVIGSSSGVVNISVTQTGDSVTISTTLDNTSAASQFLAGPTSGAGATSYRTIQGVDLPTPTATTKGGVVVNGNGLTLSGSTIAIDNSITPQSTNHHIVQYNANGLITGGRQVSNSDVPIATASATGGVRPGSGLAVDAVGTLNHSNAVAAGTATKITYDAQGHITAGTTLADTDIPNLDATKITTGQFATERIQNDAITGAKLANLSTTQIGGSGSTTGIVTFPTADYTGQYFYDARNEDLYLWDGNAWKPITITAGEIVFAGTYNAATNTVATTTTAGAAVGLIVGAGLPTATANNNRYYVVVNNSGNGTAPAPPVALAAPDMLLSDGSAWTLIDVSNTVVTQQASGISITTIAGIVGANVQQALEDLQADKAEKSAPTFTGNVTVDAGNLIFDTGSFNTTFVPTTATAARTITFPNATGTVVLAGNASIVNADISASAAIAYSKLASLASGNIIVGSAGSVPTAVAVTGDITLSNAGVTAIAAGVIVDADINSAAAIADTKLATISTADKVSISAINIDGGTDIGTALADADLFLVDDGGVGANRKAAATRITDYTFGKVSGDITISSTGTAAIGSGVIVNADINASAAIADTKLATISTAGKVSGTAITSGNISTSGSFATTSTLAVGQASAAANTDFDLAGTYAQVVVAIGALSIDCSTGNYFTKTISSNSTFTVSNVPASRAYAFTLELTHTSGTVTWFSGVEWPGGTAPTLTTGKTHLFMFVTDDGGTRWRAASLINYTT
jgi:hypothetical protein